MENDRVTFSDHTKTPKNHPIDEARARELIAGDLGSVCRNILAECAAPLFWHRQISADDWQICANGTFTFVKTRSEVIGVTAAHVVQAYRQVADDPDVCCQIMDAIFDADQIDESQELDLATFAVSPDFMAATGKMITPVPIATSEIAPQEGRGIMLGGYPGQERHEMDIREVEWGFFTALGVARRINERQITWIPDREHDVAKNESQMPPPNQDLGGISGGPLIAWYESSAGLAYYGLAGIIVEASASLENVVALRSNVIREDGRLIRN